MSFLSTYRTCLLAAVAIFAGQTQIFGATTDPVGYVTLKVPANSQGLLAVPLVNPTYFKETVVSVSGTDVTFEKTLPSGLLGTAGSGFLSIRTGEYQGFSVGVDSFSGKKVTLKTDVDTFVAPGDLIDIRPDLTLGTVFLGGLVDFLQGENETVADTVSIWDAEHQVSKVFYLNENNIWTEVGNEAAGDRSGAVIPYPSALIVTRRGDTELSFVNVGTVLIPFFERIIEVWPGRNVITPPFTAAQRVDEWIMHQPGSQFSINSGPSADKADTIQLTYEDGSQSNILYYRSGKGWRGVGQSGDAGDTLLGFAQALDFQRSKKRGFLRISGPAESPLRRALVSEEVAPTEQVGIETIVPIRGGVKVTVTSVKGGRYQLQNQPLGATEWSNLGEAVVAQTSKAVIERQVGGHGSLRIIKLP